MLEETAVVVLGEDNSTADCDFTNFVAFAMDAFCLTILRVSLLSPVTPRRSNPRALAPFEEGSLSRDWESLHVSRDHHLPSKVPLSTANESRTGGDCMRSIAPLASISCCSLNLIVKQRIHVHHALNTKSSQQGTKREDPQIVRYRSLRRFSAVVTFRCCGEAA